MFYAVMFYEDYEEETMPSHKRMSCLIRVRPWWVVALILALVTAGCSQDTPTLAGETGTAAEVEAVTADGEASAVDALAAGDDEVFTYWGGLIFSDVANQMLVDRINQWGEEQGIE